jgi:hypothetical protein
MLACLDGVHGLPRHADPLAKVSLAPASLGTQHPQAVFHQA